MNSGRCSNFSFRSTKVSMIAARRVSEESQHGQADADQAAQMRRQHDALHPVGPA